jgi:hypothetical protein
MAVPRAAAATIVASAAAHTVAVGNQETSISLNALRNIVRRVAVMPGERTIVLVSGGFLTLSDFVLQKIEIIEAAIRAKIVINSLDARGLWTDPSLDVSAWGGASNPEFGTIKQQIDRFSASTQSAVLAEMAFDTGGRLFEHNNDMDEGFRRLASAPEAMYVLGFSPVSLKSDGAFHELKVTVRVPAGMTVQARRGYYAPRKPTDPAETAKLEIQDAFLSRDVLSDLPIELRTTFFLTNEKEAKLTVRCRIDPKHMQFRKADGRNYNKLTVVSGVFDRDGNYVAGVQRIVDLNLTDQTLSKLIASGMTVNSDYTVAPGAYAIRLVVRDAEGQTLSAANGTFAIP